MKRMTVPKVKLTKEMEDYRLQLIDELLADSTVHAFLNENGLDTSFVDDHLIELLEIVEAKKDCLKCPGYAKCPKTPKGMVVSLYEHGDAWAVCYNKCKKLEEIEDLLDNYIYRDFSIEWLYNSLDKLAHNNPRRRFIVEASKIIQGLSKKNLYVYGDSGVGKSYMVAALTNDWLHINSGKVAFVNFHDFIEDCKQSFEGHNNYVTEQISVLQQVDVLVLDDLGAENVSDWSIGNVLYNIIDYRVKNGLLTIYTSLYSMSDLYRVYDGSKLKNERVIDMIKKHSTEVEVKGANLIG